MKVDHDKLGLVNALLQLAIMAEQAKAEKLRVELINKAEVALNTALSEVIS